MLARSLRIAILKETTVAALVTSVNEWMTGTGLSVAEAEARKQANVQLPIAFEFDGTNYVAYITYVPA